MRNAPHASAKPQPGSHADLVGSLVATLGKIIADVESDIAVPMGAAFHAKDALASLCLAHNELIGVSQSTRMHYEAMARDAQQAAA